MKRTLLLPPTVLLVVLALAGSAVLLFLSAGFPFRILPAVLAPLVPVAAALGVVYGYTRAVRRPLVPALAVLLVFLTISGALVGALVLARATPVDTAAVDPFRVVSPNLEPGVVYPGQRYALVVDRQSGTILSGVTVVDFQSGADRRVSRHDEGHWDRRDGIVSVPGGTSIPADSLIGFGRPTLPGVVVRAIDDAERVFGVVAARWDEPTMPSFLASLLPPDARAVAGMVVAVFAPALAIAAVWTAVRFSRWPLLNVLTAIAYLRLVFALPRLLSQPAVERIVFSRLPEWLAIHRVSVAWLLVGALGIVIAVVLPSLNRWQHDMHYREDSA